MGAATLTTTRTATLTTTGTATEIAPPTTIAITSCKHLQKYRYKNKKVIFVYCIHKQLNNHFRTVWTRLFPDLYASCISVASFILQLWWGGEKEGKEREGGVALMDVILDRKPTTEQKRSSHTATKERERAGSKRNQQRFLPLLRLKKKLAHDKSADFF